MLQVLTAQLIADERELAIQRRLREYLVRREAMTAQAARVELATARHDPAIHTEGRRCGACRPSAVGAC